MASDRQLVKQITKILKKQLGRGVDIRFDAAEDVIYAGSNQIHLVNIRRAWHQLDKGQRAEFLQASLSTLAGPSPVPEVLTDTSYLRVGLRSGSYLEALRLSSAAKGIEPLLPAHREFVPDLFEVLFWDTPHALTAVTEDLVEKWGRPLNELLDTARCNLAAVERVGFAALDDKVFQLVNGDDYDSSRLLTAEALDELPVSGDVVAFIPTRNTLMVADPANAEALVMACDLALQIDDDPAVFRRPLIRRGGEWSLLELDENHPAHEDWLALVRLEQAESANNVQDLLQTVVGEEIFVATVGLRRSGTGLVESYCAWTEDVPSLLPKTDSIAFPKANRETPIIEARWDSVMAVAGELMEATDHYPQRWRVERFPSAEQFAQMVR